MESSNPNFPELLAKLLNNLELILSDQGIDLKFDEEELITGSRISFAKVIKPIAEIQLEIHSAFSAYGRLGWNNELSGK
jgi:hypothetical protein